MILEFIKANWTILLGVVIVLGILIAVPPLRKWTWKALAGAAVKLGQAFMAMITADFIARKIIRLLEGLAKKTKGTADDKLVAQLKESLDKL